MKKVISLIMTVVICMTLASCADNPDINSNSNSQTTNSQQAETTDYASSIRFKINPEFEVHLDSKNFVVNVECLNNDAKNIFYDINVTGMSATEAIDTLLTTVFNSGVINEDVTVYISTYCEKENILVNQLINEIPNLIADAKDKTDFPYKITVETKDSITENISDSNSVKSIQQDDESSTETVQPSSQPYKQNVLCRADFDIPDVHGTGYGNLIDYCNAYPDGKDGGTFANAGLMVHYRTDMDRDLSQTDSLAFRTYRGIGLGSTRNEVFAAYGEAIVEPPFREVMGIGDAQHTVSSFVDYKAKIASGACVGIRFYFDQNDTVMFIDYSAVYLKYAGNISDSSLFPLE